MYRNFKFAKPEEGLVLLVEDLQRRVTALERLKGTAAPATANIDDEIPPFSTDEEIKPEDLPF